MIPLVRNNNAAITTHRNITRMLKHALSKPTRPYRPHKRPVLTKHLQTVIASVGHSKLPPRGESKPGWMIELTVSRSATPKSTHKRPINIIHKDPVFIVAHIQLPPIVEAHTKRIHKLPGPLVLPNTTNKLPTLHIKYQNPARLNLRACNTLIRPLPVHRYMRNINKLFSTTPTRSKRPLHIKHTIIPSTQPRVDLTKPLPTQ
mmetsp:Transcript_30861/g.74501  ORF Transcript_30861/g.74501 Transcript_30861/m.74501 type:complete len:203 (+) Transcript_30861:353-961(+)